MGRSEVLRYGCGLVFVLAALGPGGQISPRTVTGSRQGDTTILFSNEKPVLGMPLQGSLSKAHCSTDGTMFYDLSGSAETAGSELYSISSDGSVKHLLRKLPLGFTSIAVRDFFAGDQSLATLLEAEKRDDGTDDASPPRETDYFLAVSDDDGDLSDLMSLDLRFKPLKIARMGSGDYIVLGWDEGNLLPELALLKDDGTIRRFIDFDERPDAARDLRGNDRETAPERSSVTLKALEGAAFVAYGSEVLLTYPGTTRPVLVLNAAGQSRTIPVALPAGYVLNDALVTSGFGTLVLRLRSTDSGEKSAGGEADKPPKMRLFEFDANHGTRIREFIFNKPEVSAVTCAARSRLTAVFYDTIANPDKATADDGATSSTVTAANAATQLVVASARR